MPYPYEINTTANNLYEVALNANSATSGYLGVSIVFTIFITSFIILLNRYDYFEAIIGSSFGALLLSLILWGVGLLGISALQIILIIFAIFIVIAVIIDRR